MKLRMMLCSGAIGALSGYLLLAPFTVYVSHSLHLEEPITRVNPWDAFAHEPLAWDLYFIFFGAAVGLVVGFLYKGIKEREAQIKETRDYTDLVVNSLGDGLLTIDRGYRIVTANRAFLDQVGEEKVEAVKGKHCYRVSHRKEVPCFEAGENCPVRKVFETGGESDAVHVHQDIFGVSTHVELKAYPLRDSSGKVDQALEIVRDISDRMRAEEALAQYAEVLESSNILKDLFTDILSHDLLNPVTIIKSFADVLAKKENFKGAEEIESIQRNIRKLEELIGNASKYARVGGALGLDKKEVELTAVIRSAIGGLKPYFEEKEVDVVFEFGGTASAMANSLIEEVFANILSNAVKYAPVKSTVTVSLEGRDGNWLVSFDDRGEGVPDDYKEDIFQRFARKEKKGVKGSGLGLAIAKRIVDLHNGKIWVEDNPGGGSRFRVEFPKKTGEALES